MDYFVIIIFLITVLSVSLLRLKNAGQSDLVKQEIKINNVLSLKEPEINVSVIGHARRTLELRCGFAMKMSDNKIPITLLERCNSQFKRNNDHRGNTYLCKLPNGKRCFIIGLEYEISENQLSWYSHTFYPENQKEWFKYCTAEDMLIKDDETLRAIDRIEWHNKLNEKIEKLQLKRS